MADFEELAIKIETEPPSWRLRREIALALGWRPYVLGQAGEAWINPNNLKDTLILPDWLQSANDAFELIPPGWRVAEMSCSLSGPWSITLENDFMGAGVCGHCPATRIPARAIAAASMRAHHWGKETP